MQVVNKTKACGCKREGKGRGVQMGPGPVNAWSVWTVVNSVVLQWVPVSGLCFGMVTNFNCSLFLIGGCVVHLLQLMCVDVGFVYVREVILLVPGCGCVATKLGV